MAAPEPAEHPRAHRDPAFLAAKRARLHEPHVAPLTAWAASVRERTGGEVPSVDPADGGVGARALLLLEAPSARATGPSGPRAASRGSGMVSQDNDDATAATMWRITRDVGLRRDRVVAWNVVPWYLGTAERIRGARADDVAAAEPYLAELLALLPHLRVVLTLGTQARDGWLRHLLRPDTTLLPTLACPHPSPRSLNARPQARAAVVAALTRVADVTADR